MLSLVPLLLDGSTLPLEARRALKLARSAPNAAIAQGLTRSAARTLVRDLDLTWDEASELLDLSPEKPLRDAA